MAGRRTCRSCGFDNIDEGQACPLCSTPPVDEYTLADVLSAEEEERLRRGAAPQPVRDESEHHDGYQCWSCGRPFVVVYEAHPGEVRRDVPVACPRCWKTNQAPVAEGAAETKSYTVREA